MASPSFHQDALPASADGARSRRAPASLREAWLALAGLSAVFLFEMLDNSVLTVALPTIGRDLRASTTDLQWITGVYAVVFGGLMLAFGALADRMGRRRVMLIGLVLLAVASLATAFVSTAGELLAVRAAMGVAAAMTTPGSAALAFRLFADDGLRVRAMNVVSTVGIVGLAVGPTVGGLVLAVAPWQVLLIVNAPVAVLAFVGVRAGIAADDPADLHRDPVDIAGALLGTAAIVLALVAPTLFVGEGVASWAPWTCAAGALAAGVLFVVRERTARHPLLDLALVARPLVSSGLAYKAASGLATAAIAYLVTLQLQGQWGWPPALAAVGMLPQVVTLIAGGALVAPVMRRIGLERAAWVSAGAVVLGLAVYATLGPLGYPWIALALVLEALGLRMVGVVAGANVLRGLPSNRTTIGVALVDTSTQIAAGVGLVVTGTVLAALVPGTVAARHWTALQSARFDEAVLVSGLALTVTAAALVVWGFLRTRGTASSPGAPGGSAESTSSRSESAESAESASAESASAPFESAPTGTVHRERSTP